MVVTVNPSAFDLNLLLVLNAVLAEGSVAKAASRLHVTSSAVSNALARLRVLFGDPLLTRKGRGIVPTPRALELAPVLARTLRDLHDAMRAGTFNPGITTRRFTIALSDLGQVVLLPYIAALFAREMPQARLRVVGVDSLAPLGGLAGSEIDVVIGPEPGSEEIHSAALFEQAAVLICRQEHPALASRPTPKVMSTLRHVAVEMAAGQGLPNLAGLAYQRAGIARDVVITVPTFSAAAAVVAATDFVATVPMSLYVAMGHAMRLGTLPLPVPEMRIATNMCWHERTHADATAAGFRDIVRRAVTDARASVGTSITRGGQLGKRLRRR